MWTKQLIDSGVSIVQFDTNGSTPLHLAARRGNLEQVIVLLQAGCDMNAKGENGW